MFRLQKFGFLSVYCRKGLFKKNNHLLEFWNN
jgi:hypothetical protein